MAGVAVSISVVIPVYREGEHLDRVLTEIRQVGEGLGEPHEILVVDDGSADDTWPILHEQSKSKGRNQSLRAIRLSRNFGKEAAVCAGLEAARGEAVIVMDGDLQHPPSLIPEMVRLWRETGASVVEGVKKHRGNEGIARRIGRRWFYGALRRLSGFDLRNATDFKLIDTRVRDAWLRMGERNLFFRGMIAWLGFRREQIEFVAPDRMSGESRWSFLDIIRLALTGLTAFSSLPLRLVSLAGVGLFALAVILGAQTLAFKISGRAVAGFTTVILLQLIIGSILMFSLGTIGEYIARIYDEVKGRPRYIVAETTDSSEEDD